MGEELKMFYGEIEGTGFQAIDKRFGACFVGHARVERLWTGCRWAEGPAWFPAHRALVWSDIPNNRMLRWDEQSGHVSVFRQPTNNTNGNAVDTQGRLVSCEHLGRRVVRTEHDGSITVLADKWQGKRLNSPNDVTVRSDGSIWFTDPDFGIGGNYEGDPAVSEIGGCHVYRIDPASGAVDRVADDFVEPNGIAFSPDERFLYVVDSGGLVREGGPHHIRRLEVKADGRSLGGSQVVGPPCAIGWYDGLRTDTTGRIWVGAGDGVHCIEPSGTLIGKIRIPEMVANLTFGGPKRNRLLICGTTSLYAAYTTVVGAGRS
jgi:gluconolactonase